MGNKRILIIAIAGIVLIIGIYFLVKGNKGSEDTVLENAQGTLEEQEGEESKISFDGSISKGEVVDVEFRFRDYKDVPDDPKTIQETIDALIDLEGSVSFEIIKIGRAKGIRKKGTIVNSAISSIRIVGDLEWISARNAALGLRRRRLENRR